ncbi:P-loop containing nucleoside triphosphate hydrolase [Phytophthora cactorum]|nr:P-loop containing nucleoside triphosphate hydrolase [Phytophthora cactorum]
MTSNKDAVAASTLTSPAQEQQEAASPRPLQPDAEEPLVKKRRTKNFQLREDLAKSRGSVTVHVPAFEPLTFDTWDAFIQAWNGYMTRTKTMYRRRSSSTTTYWNNKHKFKKYPVPEDFKYATMAYWCTHGCIQPSRGNGVRTHLHNRYTGCSARITADVVFEVVDGEPNRVRWLVRVRNQISQHNHRISDEIYNCYTNNSSVPDELLLGPEAEQKQEPQGDELRDAAVLTSVLDAAVSGFMLKEALANDHKMNMAASEMQPLLEELRNTPSRVIHKRLQDVAEMVAHLQAKWHQDRIAEEAAQAHAVPIASLAVEQAAAASSEALGKANAISSIASLPPGAAYYLTPRVEQITTETSRAVSTAASTDSRSGDEAASTQATGKFQKRAGSADEEEHMSDHEIEGNNQDDSDDGCDFNELAAETSSLASSESSSFVCNEQATITAIRVRPMLLSEKKSGYRVIVDMSTNNDGLLIRIVNPTALPPASRGRYTPMESANFPVQFTQEFWFDYSYWSFDRSPAHQVATQSTIYDELGVLALQTVLQGQTALSSRMDNLGQGRLEIPMKNKLCLVDLASSERVDHSGTSGSRREAASVNRSLATLVDVVGALAKRKSHGSHQKTFVPYRNSVLTRLLKDCLGGRAKTIMIGVISPCCAHYEESIATLKSIERARSLHSTGRLQADTSRNTTLRFLGDVNELKLNLCASNEVKIPSTVSYGEVPEHNDECSGCESCDDADLTSTQAPFEAKAEEMKINLTESDDAELKYMQQRSLPMEFPVDRTEQEHPEALVSLKSVHLMNLIAICRRWQTLRQYRALDRWRKVVSLENKTTTGLLVNRDNKNEEDIKVEGNASPQRSIGRRAGCPPLHTRVSTGEARTADHVQDVVAAVDATDAICCSVVQDFLFPHHPDSPNSLLQKANTAASASLLELLASSSEFDRFEYCFDNSSNNEPPLEELTSPEGWNNVEEGELSLPENDSLKAGDEESTVASKLSLCLDSIDMARRALGPGVHSLRCQAKGSIMTANGTVVECELLRYLDKRFITMEWSFEELMVASQLHPRSAPLLSTCEALEEMVGELCLQIIPKLCDQLPSSSSACVAGRLQLETQLEHFSDRIKRQLLPEIARGSNGSETNQSSVDAVLYLATELLVMTERIKIVWNLSGHKKRERLLQAQAAVIKNRKYAAKIADLEERNEELAAKCDALLATSGRLDGSSLNEHELDNQEHVNRDTARTDVMVEQLGMDLTLKNDENLEEKLAKEVARARDVQARNDELLSRFAVLNHALAAASARVAELEAENNLNSDAREMNLASSVTSMEAQVAKLQSELEEAHIHAQDLESQLVESKRLSQEQTSELERVKAHLSSEKDARNKVEANFVTVQMQVDELKHHPAHAESRFKDLEEAESAKREEKWQIVNTSLMDTQANNAELSALFVKLKLTVKHAALMDQVSIQADQISVLERCTLQDKQRLLELEARLAATVQERDEHILLFSQTEEALASALDREKVVQCQLAGSSTRESEEMNRVRGELHESTLELASLREELAELLDHSTLQSSTIETLTLEQTETLQKAQELEVERDELTLQCQVEQDALELKERAYKLLSEQSAETLSRMERQQEIEREECMAVHETLQRQTIAFQKLQARQHSIKMDYYSTIRDLKGQVETSSAKSRTLNEELAAKAKALEAVHSEAEDRIQKIEEQAKRTVHKQGEIACGLSEQLQECRTDLNASMGLWVRAETQCGVLRICIEQLNCHRTEAKEACMMQLADAESCQLRDYHRHDLAQATAETELAVHENLSSLDAWFDEVISGNPAITESLSSHQAAAISVPQSTEDRDEERLSMLKTLTDLTALTNELLVVCESSPQSNNLSVEASQNALEQHDTNKDTNGLKQDFQETIPNSKEDCKTQKMTEQKKEKASGEVVQLSSPSYPAPHPLFISPNDALQIQLGGANDGLCHFLSLGGFEMLLDCGVKSQTLQRSPKRGGGFVYRLQLPALSSVDVGALDVVLLSNHQTLLALPLLTEILGFKGKIYATQLTLDFGRVFLEELAALNQGDDSATFTFEGVADEKEIPMFSLKEIEKCCKKIQCVEYSEVVSLAYGVQITALSSGYSLGASIWLVEGPNDRLAYVAAASGDYNRHPKELDLLPLVDCETLLLTDLKPDRDPHANTERMVERVLSGVTRVLERGGVCIVPTSPCGVVFDLVEAVYAACVHNKQNVPMYFISDFASHVMELTQLGAEWLCEKKIEKLSNELVVVFPIDPSVDATEAIAPFQDLPIEKIACPIDPRLSCGDANQFIARCCPHNLIVPYEYTIVPPATAMEGAEMSSHFSRVLPLHELTAAKSKTELLTFPMKQFEPIVVEKTSKYLDGRLDPKLAAQATITEVNGKAAACVSGVLSVKRKAFVLEPPVDPVNDASNLKPTGKRKASSISDDTNSTLQSIVYKEKTNLLMGQVDEDKLEKQVKTVRLLVILMQRCEIFTESFFYFLFQHDPQAQVYISQGQGDADVFMSIPSLDARITLWKETGKTLVETEKEEARALLTSFILAQLVAKRLRNRLNYAASRVQVAYRRHSVYLSQQKREAAVSIQTLSRGFLARRLCWRLRMQRQEHEQNCSSVIISRCIRRCSARIIRAREVERRHWAACSIQSILRMVAARCYVQEQRRLREEAELQHRAAIVIQSNARSFMTRLIYLDVLYLICRIQAVMRGCLVRRQLWWLRISDVDAISKLQAHVRGFLVRRRREKEQENGEHKSVSSSRSSQDQKATQPDFGASKRKFDGVRGGFRTARASSFSVASEEKLGRNGIPTFARSSTGLGWQPTVEPAVKRSYWLPAGASFDKRLPVLPVPKRMMALDRVTADNGDPLGDDLRLINQSWTPKKRPHQKPCPVRLSPVVIPSVKSEVNDLSSNEVEEDVSALEKEERLRRQEELKQKLQLRRTQGKRQQELELKLKREAATKRRQIATTTSESESQPPSTSSSRRELQSRRNSSAAKSRKAKSASKKGDVSSEDDGDMSFLDINFTIPSS